MKWTDPGNDDVVETTVERWLSLRRFMWWHAFMANRGWGGHRLHQDINRHRMLTMCDCGETWVCT